MESYLSSFEKPSSFPAGFQNAASAYQGFNSKNIQSSLESSPSSFPVGLQSVASAYQEYNSEYTQSPFKKSGPFLFGLHNMAKSYQARPEGSLDPVLRMPLKGAQEGLVLTITSQDYIVH